MSDNIRYAIDKSKLVTTEVPAQTNHYKPISHRQLIEQTLEGIDREGFSLKSEKYLGAKDGKQATGRYELVYGNDPEMGLMIAWQNSYDKSISLKYAVGAYVFVCSNGACFGD